MREAGVLLICFPEKDAHRDWAMLSHQRLYFFPLHLYVYYVLYHKFLKSPINGSLWDFSVLYQDWRVVFETKLPSIAQNEGSNIFGNSTKPAAA